MGILGHFNKLAFSRMTANAFLEVRVSRPQYKPVSLRVMSYYADEILNLSVV